MNKPTTTSTSSQMQHAHAIYLVNEWVKLRMNDCKKDGLKKWIENMDISERQKRKYSFFLKFPWKLSWLT